MSHSLKSRLSKLEAVATVRTAKPLAPLCVMICDTCTGDVCTCGSHYKSEREWAAFVAADTHDFRHGVLIICRGEEPPEGIE